MERGITLAWLTANYSRAKTLPDLDRILEKIKVEKKPQTSDEVAAIFEHFAGMGKARMRVRKRKRN